MRSSSLVAIAIVGACTAAQTKKAHADEIKHPAGFTFALPKLGKAWVQETHGNVIVVEDDSDTLPELQIFAFPVKHEGELSDIVKQLPSEIVRPGVERLGTPVKTAKLDGTPTKQAIADTTAMVVALTIDVGDRAAFAIVQRSGHSLILLAVPKDGIYERGLSNFKTVLQGLKAVGSTSKAATPAPPSANLPKLPDLIAVRDISASSTYADKRGMYAAWRTLSYDAVLDEKTQEYLPTTAWCEGKPDEGIGEGLTISFASPTRLDEIHVAAGVWRSEQLFTSNNRITSLDIVVDGKTTKVQPAASRKWLTVPIGATVSTIGIKIGAVAKGKMNDSCISGISLVRKSGDYATIVDVDAAAVAELPRALAKLQSALGAADGTGLDGLVDFPLTVHKQKYASAKSLKAACATALGADVDPSRCPTPLAFRSGDDRVAVVNCPEPGTVEVLLPGQHEDMEAWKLRWHDGAWRLASMSSK